VCWKARSPQSRSSACSCPDRRAARLLRWARLSEATKNLAGEAISVPRWRNAHAGLKPRWRKPDVIRKIIRCGPAFCRATFFGDVTKKAAVMVRNVRSGSPPAPRTSVRDIVNRGARRRGSAGVRGCRSDCRMHCASSTVMFYDLDLGSRCSLFRILNTRGSNSAPVPRCRVTSLVVAKI
jgi:hypothetical protein